MKHRNDAGFTLVEVMVAIVIVGLITVPMTSGLVLGMKTLARAEQMMESQLAVSSAVEKLMATGINRVYDKETDENGVVIDAQLDSSGLYYIVTVSHESVEVKTEIRAVELQGGGDGE